MKNKSLGILILVDNVRIGGFQRLALDQAYQLIDLGYQVSLASLMPLVQKKGGSLLKLEESRVVEHGLNVIEISGGHFSQIWKMRRFLRNNRDYEVILSHSLRGTVLSRVIKWGGFRSVKLLTTIHQLPTLSAPIQRLRRFIYSQFTDYLFGYSAAVVQDWNTRVSHFPSFLGPLFRKEIRLLRNGVYLPRLSKELIDERSQKPRLIFLGRTIAWKGLDLFSHIVSAPELRDFDILLMVPSRDGLDFESLDRKFGERLQLIVGKTVEAYSPRFGDVHLYPTSYGSNTTYLESISLNCLEMASMGVASLVTENGLETWPDEILKPFFLPVNWGSSRQCIESIIKASQKSVTRDQITNVRNLLSINNQIEIVIGVSQL